MPNHVINEIVFKDLSEFQKKEILSSIVTDDNVDFSILLPKPLNIWRYSVEKKHKDTFPDTGLNWARKNWGTKWNAYESIITTTETTITFVFQTAWSPPMGWTCALHNKFNHPFVHKWMSEGGSGAYREEWSLVKENDCDPWKRSVVEDEQEKRHIHKLLWGVEQFEDEEE